LRKVRVLLTIVVSFTSLEGTLALAGATLEEALLVPSEGAAVEAPVPVGYLQPRLLLAQLRARGAAVSPRGVVIVEQCVALVEADASLGRLLALIQTFSIGSLAHRRRRRKIATRNIRVFSTQTLIGIPTTRVRAGIITGRRSRTGRGRWRRRHVVALRVSPELSATGFCNFSPCSIFTLLWTASTAGGIAFVLTAARGALIIPGGVLALQTTRGAAT